MTFDECFRIQQQIEKDSIDWARDVVGIKDKSRLDAYRAGLQQGMREIICKFKLNGAFDYDDAVKEERVDVRLKNR